MRKTKLLYSLALAPLLLGGYNSANIGQESEALTVTSLASCPDGQFLIYRSGAVKCEAVQGSGVTLPDCKSQGQLLTYTKVGELAQYGCTRKGLITLSTMDTTTLATLQTQITQIGTTITQIGTGTRVAARTYLGPTSVSFTGGMVATGVATGAGINAGNAQCVKDYGASASMCDVYGMYLSIAAGKIDPAKLQADIPKLWVYQASGPTAMTANAAADNCNGYTNTTNAGTFGTSFTMTPAPASNATTRVPKFFTNTPCNTAQPVACCQ